MGCGSPTVWIAGRLAGKKVVLHLNDTYTPGVVKILFAAIGRLSDEFIVAGLGVRNAYFTGFNRSLGRKAITEIQAPVDTAHFDPGRVDSDGRLGGDDSIKITAVGNINPLKGLEYFIDMAHMLNALHTGLTFHVIGPQLASQEAYFRRLMALLKEKGLENVVFHGGSEDIAPALKASDIFICSSLREASPMAVWEAMAMKKAIVSTDVGDVSRFIDNGENGFVVPIKDAAALAEKVGVLIEGETMRRRFGDGVRVIATRELSLDSCVAKHEAVYSQVLATDGSATA